MYAQTSLVTSVRGAVFLPHTAASASLSFFAAVIFLSVAFVSVVFFVVTVALAVVFAAVF